MEYVGTLKGCKFEHTELSNHSESFKYEITRVNIPFLKRIRFQYLTVNLQPWIF